MHENRSIITITELAPRVAAGEMSPSDLVRSCLTRIADRSELNAFITVLADDALADAEAAATEIRRGHYRGPLHGIPISIKDLIHVAGVPTTSGSALPPMHPTADAPVVQRLRNAGAIIVGKTNLHEFAFGTTSEESAFGPVRNPFDPTRSAGGSSGGAAVALVEGMCFGSIGTDTGGSIRIPAAACGIVGLKPALGELSCDGIVPLSTTCDHVGPMMRSVQDATMMFGVLRGRDVDEAALPSSLTLGIPKGYLVERLDPEIRQAFERVQAALKSWGHRIVDIAIGLARSTPDVYLHIVLPEAAAYHAPLLEQHASLYWPNVRNRLETGRYVLAEDYVRAMRLRGRLMREVNGALETCDALLLPTMPIVAPPLGAASVDVDGHFESVRAAMLRLTQLFNVTGHPAISLPAGITASGLPIGMQLVGPAGNTDRLLAIAASLEPQMTAGPGSVGGGTG
jgi:aspartyl-tRNA(Asn)/glutamyl-tRNA(Gln) amidotransferase subunit A